MIIDITNSCAVKIDHYASNKLAESIFIYAPDCETLNNVKKQYEKEGFSKKLKQIIQDDEMEISYIQVNWNSHSLIAFRSITSHYEIFYKKINLQNKIKGKTGDIIITDHFINILSYIPVFERSVCLSGVCDMFLYQHNYGKETYIKDIYRLGYGEELAFNNNRIYVKQIQLLQLRKYDLKGQKGTHILEEALKKACGKMKRTESINTLSGGVDSTLTHIIMGNPASVSASYQTKEFLCEKEYAKEAANILRANHIIYDISMESYMKRMIKVVKQYGFPTYNMTTLIIHNELANKVLSKHMILSELAGAVCGLKLRKDYSEECKRYTMINRNNYANRNSMIAREEDIDYIIKIFGTDLVEQRLENRNQFVLNKLHGLDAENTERDYYIQYAHLIDYYTNNGVESVEQTEIPYGKTVNSLYSSKQLLEKFLSIDIHSRYYNEVYGEKPYEKKLLEKLLPNYDVKKQKLGGSLPRTWMVTKGPMAGYFKEHEIPSFVDKLLYPLFLDPSWETSWCTKYLIMYSVWYENVMCQEVEKIPSKFQVNLDILK